MKLGEHRLLGQFLLRGLGDPDVFPATDLGLVKAWEALGGVPLLLEAAEVEHRKLSEPGLALQRYQAVLEREPENEPPTHP